jgi:hypothetical protein
VSVKSAHFYHKPAQQKGELVNTDVHTPQVIFNLPQRLLVPLFQRPYVWDEERQWRPLWQDVERVAVKVLASDFSGKHFLGAIVLQQEMTSTGTLITRTIIDGQQRLTTLQLLFDAIYEEILKLGFDGIARRLGDLIENAEHQKRNAEDRFKVWPTNRDRDAFVEVMGTPAPKHNELQFHSSKIVKAHEFFSIEARAWLTADSDSISERANALVDAVATRLQIVVIDLKADEDAQEIFETLNARGTPLTAADLIKNLVFQRLNVSPQESEKAYFDYWRQFETSFWEEEVSSGRVLWSRSSLFLNQWLTSQTRNDIPAREVFTSFKRHLDDTPLPVIDTLRHIFECANSYQALAEAAAKRHDPLTPLEMFMYRSGEMQSEIVKPIIIWLTDPKLVPIPEDQLNRAVAALESWLVRRTLVREKSAGHNRFMIDLLGKLVEAPRETIGSSLEAILVEQVADASYWPDDDAIQRALAEMQVYKRISRGRLRMILEAVEDHRRGFPSSKAKGEQPVVRTECTIEHVMPQRWGQHWPLPADVRAGDRDARIHTLGNLTLVSKALNPSLSNGAWLGDRGKRTELENYSSLKLTSDVIQRADKADGRWTDELIEERTEALIRDILLTWPVPTGHTNVGRSGAGVPGARISVRDLIRAELIKPGDVLVSARPAYPHGRAIVHEDGTIEVDGRLYDTPSGAAKGVSKARAFNGWTFWRLHDINGPRLRELLDLLEPRKDVREFGPFAAEDLEKWWLHDNPALDELALAITDALPKRDTQFPSQFGKGDYRVSRYWAYDAAAPNICVGIPKAPILGGVDTPIWARYHPETNEFATGQAHILRARHDAIVNSETGCLWIPLMLDSNLKDAELLEDLAQQVRIIDQQARGSIT